MERSSYKVIVWLMLIIVLLLTAPALGWHDKTHLAISQAAGYEQWYNSAAPDVTKTKAEDIEAPNHWCNNRGVGYVTETLVLEQAKCYDHPEDTEGHLYGAIIGAVRKYKKEKTADKYAEYNLAFCAHYIGDLSMPFHNILFGENQFNNQERHSRNDGVIEASVMHNIGFIQRNMCEIRIASEQDLAREIARVANGARRLAARLEREHQRDMSQDEAYKQIVQSASLLKAVLVYARGTKQ